jgi:hypothetical protein
MPPHPSKCRQVSRRRIALTVDGATPNTFATNRHASELPRIHSTASSHNLAAGFFEPNTARAGHGSPLSGLAIAAFLPSSPRQVTLSVIPVRS